MTTIGRTLLRLRRLGYQAGVVERWLPKIDKRSDLWHFADVIGCRRRGGVLLVQCTTSAHVGDRLAKARARPELAFWLAGDGRRFEVHGWTKRGARWHCRVVEVKAGDLEPVELEPLPRRRRRMNQPTLFG